MARDRQDLQSRWTLADRLVSYLDPVRAVNRQRARAAEAVLGGYTGGRRDRRQTQNWKAGVGDANADQLRDLATLRARSRDLVRNAPIAGGAINTVCTSVVGTGLSVQPTLDADYLGLDETSAEAWRDSAKREFGLWANSSNCDATRAQNFYGLQDLAFRSALENGDVLALTPTVPRLNWPYQLTVQLIEADRLSNPKHVNDTTAIAGGVEVDSMGAPRAYHIARSHPGSVVAFRSLEWDRVEAYGAKTGRRNALHLFAKLRVGQTRGMPYLAPVVEPLKQLDRYSEAEINAAVVGSLFTVFVRTQDGADIVPPQDGTTPANPYDPEKFTLGSGALLSLAAGDTVEFANPSRPSPAFDPFVQSIFRQIGVALELPFEVLIKHYTASYSAARAALLEAWKFFRCKRAWLAANFCQPLYELFIDECVANGRLSAPGYFRDPTVRAAYLCAQWVGDGPGAIDPLKEANAAEKRMQIGLTTLAEETMAYSGADWEDNVDQRNKELAAGAPSTVATPAGAAPAVDPNAPADGGSDLETPEKTPERMR